MTSIFSFCSDNAHKHFFTKASTIAVSTEAQMSLANNDKVKIELALIYCVSHGGGLGPQNCDLKCAIKDIVYLI